jgi:hypothetical protein
MYGSRYRLIDRRETNPSFPPKLKVVSIVPQMRNPEFGPPGRIVCTALLCGIIAVKEEPKYPRRELNTNRPFLTPSLY